MLTVVVRFETREEDAQAFREAVLQQAQNSLDREPSCRRFDVSVDPENPGSFLLYEQYDDDAAFDQHVATVHFANFSNTVADWVVSKAVSRWQSVSVTS